MSKVAFIGLGIMGSRMAANLLKHDVDLTVYNRTRSIAEELGDQGAKVAESTQACVQEADIVFTMLSSPQVVEQVAFGEQGFIKAMPKNALWVDCSTVDPQFSVQTADRAKEMNIRFMDAPVAGTKPHAANAELVFFVGGETKTLNQVAFLLEYMGRKTMHIGDIGKGAAFKMLVNSMLAQSMLMFSESVLLGEKMGLDRSFLLDVLPHLVVVPPFVKAKVTNIKTDDFEVAFPLELMLKDLHLVNKMAYHHGQPQYLASAAEQRYNDAAQAGFRRLDFSAIFKYLDK